MNFERLDQKGVRAIKEHNYKPQSDATTRSPVHVVYGGADRFTASTAQKLGAIALKTLETYAPDPLSFANAFGLQLPERFWASVTDTDRSDAALTPISEDSLDQLYPLVYALTTQKLQREPVEDFRIDFEDGYGFRSDDEEDGHARSAAAELARSYLDGTITAFCGFRIKSFAEETIFRAERTMSIFLEELLNKTAGVLPHNFVVTLPKVSSRKQIKRLVDLLEKFEDSSKLAEGAIGIEIMIETPQAIFDPKGRLGIPRLVRAAKARCTSAHFGAYDYTASLGIAAQHQAIDHPAADLARQLMLISLVPLGIRLSDSVTTRIPMPIHTGGELTEAQVNENRQAITDAWQTHFRNVSRSMANGFYQSWDLHPNQLPARYAAVYSFYLRGFEDQARRLKTFIERATKASMTGTTFDDAASARGLVTFFERGVGCGAFAEEEVAERIGRQMTDLKGLFDGKG